MAASAISENAAASIMNEPFSAGDLADLCAALDDFESLTIQISGLKKDTSGEGSRCPEGYPRQGNAS
jgi:hypothetical protein